MKVLAENEETGCCKRFIPDPWMDKQVNFENRLFLKDHVTSVFHIPLNYGKVMKRDMELIENAGAKPAESLMLTDENSLWGSDIYIEISKPIPGADVVKIPGTFLSKVFEGSFSEIGQWTEEMKAFVESTGKVMKKLYFFYTTCPACAKAYGKNYIVLLAEI